MPLMFHLYVLLLLLSLLLLPLLLTLKRVWQLQVDGRRTAWTIGYVPIPILPPGMGPACRGRGGGRERGDGAGRR